MRKMKDSKIEWVGEIPETWEVVKVKHKFHYKKEIVGCYCDDYERLALTMQNVVKRSKDDNTGLQPDKFETYQILRKDELVFKLIDLQNVSTSRVGLSPFTGIVSPAYIILRAEKGMSPRYAEKYFYVLWKNQIFNAFGDDGVRSNLGKDDLLDVRMPIPPISEQQRIADFLDRGCEKIDGLKADIGAQIDTLEQYKHSVITEAVTHGLDPNVPMKDSGVEFFGEIPTDWNIMRTKYVATSIIKGNGITKEDVVPNGDIPCVRYGEIYSKYNISFRECKTRTNKGNVPILTFCQYGDILFAGTGELVEEIGKNIVYLGAQECLAGGDIIILRHNQNPSFLNYALYAAPSQAQKSSGKSKLKVVHISAFEIGNILIALPPLSEQKAIADYLDEKCAQIDELISQKQSQIETLETYKKSLIFEYVTGKKEVV